MYYTVYQITNKINNKIYIGVHQTTDLNDDYFGSGLNIRRAIEKYGIENFEKEILYIFDNPDDMFLKESELVNEDFVSREDTYNIKLGGFGGWDYVNLVGKSVPIQNQKNRLSNEERLYRRKLKLMSDKHFREVYRMNISSGLKSHYDMGATPHFLGKRHTDETKRKLVKLIVNTNQEKEILNMELVGYILLKKKYLKRFQ